MQPLPDGVVTFLFTDVEGSTRLWEDAPDTMMAALRQHDRAIEDAAIGHDGVPVRPRGEGDSRFVVFAAAADAVAAAAEMQRTLDATDWPTPRPLRIRASLHTGDADLQLGDYYGPAVNRAARLRGIAHGGQTLVSGATWELVNDRLPVGVSLTDMGQHRLKDLTRPEHVYQLDIEGHQHVFPPLASLDAVPNNLPVQLSDFIGRQVELAAVKRLLDSTRAVTILAPGGAGKTRLAIQAAADLTAEYPDGVFFVDLAPVEAADAIVQTVAESLGLALSADEDVQAQLLTYLTNKRQLLVFDNFEHVIAGAPIVTAILQGAPQVTVLTTSRSALRVTGETVFTLEGLESTWKDPEEALETSGAGLFVDAARRARPEFTLRTDDLEALASIMRLTDGMPLGIILAAAWSSLLSIREIAAEMATSLDFLETDSGDVPGRQRSVRAAFDYTWKLLSPEERRVFTALSVFRGGFTRPAAEAVATASLRDLAGLAAKSLVTTDPDTGRSTIHELLRQYAEAELASDPELHERVLDAHAAFYSELGGELFPPGTTREGLAALEADIDNIRRAWRHSLAKENADQARRLIGPLWAVYEVRGWYPSAVMLFDEALDAFDEDSGVAPTDVTRALAAAVQAWFLALQSRPIEGEAATGVAVEILRASDEPAALWLALIGRALNLAYTGRDFSGVADEGIALGESLDDPFRAAVFKNWRGGAALMAGDFDTARQRLIEGMAVYERLGERYWLSLNLQHQAQLATAEGRTDAAVDLYGRSAGTAEEIGAVRVLQMSAAGLGDANLASGDYTGAESAYLQSLVTSEQMGMVHEMLSLVAKIAAVRAATGSEREAVELLGTVLADPASAQQAVFDGGPVEEAAIATLDELRSRIPPEEFAAAEAVGGSRPFDVAVKELTSSSGP
jgi:predicted ATPase/class 3 adenylate cyclase